MNSVTLPAIPSSVPLLVESVIDAAKKSGLNQTAQLDIQLAAEEMIVNIVNYAYPDQPGMILLETFILGGDRPGLRIRISDHGKSFNPISMLDPEIDVPLAERRIGGLGIFIAKEKADRFFYECRNDTNILVMEKFLSGKSHTKKNDYKEH